MKVEDGGRSPTAHGILTQPRRYMKRGALALIPSPLQRRLAPHLSKPPRIHPTSYLDGLRGLASLIVFAHHYTCEYVYPYVAYYGVSADKMPSSPVQLPFVRVVYAGRPMVHIFFVISGFVLSKKPLGLVRAHRYHELLTTRKVFSESFLPVQIVFCVVRHVMGTKCCRDIIVPSNFVSEGRITLTQRYPSLLFCLPTRFSTLSTRAFLNIHQACPCS